MQQNYTIKCDSEINTPDVIAKNELRAKITLKQFWSKELAEELCLGDIRSILTNNILKDIDQEIIEDISRHSGKKYRSITDDWEVQNLS